MFPRDIELVTPKYGGQSLVNIPSTILSCLGVKTDGRTLPNTICTQLDGAEKIILLLLDGLGYTQFLRAGGLDFFTEIEKKGMIVPLTTTFPSSTAPAITSINTGLTPQEHGLPDWYTYFREIEMILLTLPFRPFDHKDDRRFYSSYVDPSILFKGTTIYERLHDEGIKSYTLMKRHISKGAFSKLAHRGSGIVPYLGMPDLVVRLRKLVEEPGSAYLHVYIDDIDAIAHEFGPGTEEYSNQLSVISYILQREFLEKLDPDSVKNTTLIATADHGQVNVRPENTLYLNRYGWLVDSFERNSRGTPILPTGGPRDVMLHIAPDMLDSIEARLRGELAGKAKVIRTSSAVQSGIFGLGEARKEFLDRIGNLLILPTDNGMIWYEFPGERMEVRGMHGGMTEDEILIPFMAARLADIIR